MNQQVPLQLFGKDIAQDIKQSLAQKTQTSFKGQQKFVAVLFFWDDFSSATYVKHKQKYGNDIGLPVLIFGQHKHPAFPNNESSRFDDVGIYLNQKYDSIFKIMELISYLNYESDCVGIIVQLPLPERLKPHQVELLSAIAPSKDIDGLGGVCTGLAQVGRIEFTPATPKSVLTLLDAYNLGEMKGKLVAIIVQSNIVGKPLIFDCIRRGAMVVSFNHENSLQEIKEITKKADYIISCTGQVHLLDASFVRADNSQIVIDVGYGHIDGKPVGDVNFDEVAPLVKAYTPVPGGIGPLTVASLFSNVFVLQDQKEILKRYTS